MFKFGWLLVAAWIPLGILVGPDEPAPVARVFAWMTAALALGLWALYGIFRHASSDAVVKRARWAGGSAFLVFWLSSGAVKVEGAKALTIQDYCGSSLAGAEYHVRNWQRSPCMGYWFSLKPRFESSGSAMARSRTYVIDASGRVSLPLRLRFGIPFFSVPMPELSARMGVVRRGRWSGNVRGANEELVVIGPMSFQAKGVALEGAVSKRLVEALRKVDLFADRTDAACKAFHALAQLENIYGSEQLARAIQWGR